MKHFENLWEEAENVAEKYVDKNTLNALKLNSKLEKLNDEDRIQLIGNIIFELCFLTKKYDINSWAALEEVMNDCKTELLEE